jgi:hypothetical protein
LSYEIWDAVFKGDVVNKIFNLFLNTYLNFFYSSFPLIEKRKKTAPQTPWTTSRIRISYKHKRDLYIANKNSKDPSLATYYKNYCKILSKVIGAAKRLTYDKQINSSDNKVKLHGRLSIQKQEDR